MQFFGLGIFDIFILIGLIIVLGIVIQAIFLGIGLGFVNGTNRELGSTFVTALLMGLVSWIPCLGCILSWYFIKSRHGVGWGGALAAWILGGIIMGIVLVVLFLTVFAGLYGAIIGGLIPGFTLPTMP
jgi:hypothetical protein